MPIYKEEMAGKSRSIIYETQSNENLSVKNIHGCCPVNYVRTNKQWWLIMKLFLNKTQRAMLTSDEEKTDKKKTSLQSLGEKHLSQSININYCHHHHHHQSIDAFMISLLSLSFSDSTTSTKNCLSDETKKNYAKHFKIFT